VFELSLEQAQLSDLVLHRGQVCADGLEQTWAHRRARPAAQRRRQGLEVVH
jgi:hypothetical protein